MISKHKNELPKNTIAPYIDFDLMNSLQQKETFYKLCEKHGVDYPGTIIHNKEMGHDFEIKLPACLTKSFEFERINHKKSSAFCALSGFSEDEAYDSALPLLLSVFQSITLPRPRFSLSSVNMLSCNGENPFRTNESVSSEKLTGDNSLKYLLTHTNRQLSERIPD